MMYLAIIPLIVALIAAICWYVYPTYQQWRQTRRREQEASKPWRLREFSDGDEYIFRAERGTEWVILATIPYGTAEEQANFSTIMREQRVVAQDKLDAMNEGVTI